MTKLIRMTNTRKIGATGLSILEIKPSSPPVKKKTAQDVATWVTGLPMADIGAAAKKLFLLLNEISMTPMTAEERYAVMEPLREPNKTICTALKRHYIEQRAPLTERKLIIATLRETLLNAMSDNYKIILEDLHALPSLTPEQSKLMGTAIVRIYYYLNVILIARYQLYTYPPENVWFEIYLLYKYAKQRNMLDLRVPDQFATNKHETSIMEAFMRIILLYATDPYQWRQREQHSMNKAIEMWALYPTIYEVEKIPADKKAGIFIIDLEQDQPPTLYSFKHLAVTPTCVAIDLENSVQHLREILQKMQSDHLKAKIENPNDPEFSVTAPTISKLINIWSQTITRNSPRFPIKAQIKIVFGLTAAHYYLNNEKEFNPHPANIRANFGETPSINRSLASTLHTDLYEVIEEIEVDVDDGEELLTSDSAAAKPEIIDEEAAEEGVAKELLYHIYTYDIENINPHGFCIVIRDNSYPPFQSGEIVAFKNITDNAPNWGIGAVRWLRRLRNEDFQIGIQILAPSGKAAGVQMLRGDQTAGRLLRCLVLPEDKEAQSPPMLITAASPIHSKSVMLYIENEEPLTATLSKEVDASGMYYQYVYSTQNSKDTINKVEEAPKKPKSGPDDEEKTNTEFDKIWGDL